MKQVCGLRERGFVPVTTNELCRSCLGALHVLAVSTDCPIPRAVLAASNSAEGSTGQPEGQNTPQSGSPPPIATESALPRSVRRAAMPCNKRNRFNREAGRYKPLVAGGFLGANVPFVEGDECWVKRKCGGIGVVEIWFDLEEPGRLSIAVDGTGCRSRHGQLWRRWLQGADR